MTTRNVGFRLGMDGKAEVKNDFAEVQKAGEASMDSVATAAETAGERAARATETYTKRQIDSYQKQANAAKLAAAGMSNNASFDDALSQRGSGGQFATVNLDRSSGAAKASAAVFAEAFAEEERQAREAAEAQRLVQKAEEDRAATVAKLRALLDPLAVAQHRYDEELATYSDLLKRGDLNEAEHAKAVGLSAARLNEARKALDGHSDSLGFNRTQQMMFRSAAFNSASSLAAGMPVYRVFMEQGLEVGQAFGEGNGGAAASLSKLRALLTPTTLAIGAGAAVAAAAAKSWYDFAAGTEKLNAAAHGSGLILGLTGQQLETAAEAAAADGHMSTDSAREIEAAYLGIAKSGEVLVGMTAITGDFAKATGRDLAAAQSALGAAFQDPIEGAQKLAGEYGFLTQAQVEHIAKLVEEGDYARAQAELQRDLAAAIGGVAARTDGLVGIWNRVKQATDGAWVSLGKYLDLYGQASLRLQGLGGLLADPQTQRQKVDAARNQALQRAMDVAGGFAGDQRDDYRKQLGTLRAGLNALPANASADDRKQLTGAIDAYSNAIATFIPRQQKANELAAIDAKLAAAKAPAEKAALAAQRERASLAGTVISATDAATRATEAGNRARAQGSKAGAGHPATLAREAASMEASARAALDVADAYLKSSAAGVEAEARRKALTDATKKGIDVEAQVRRQLALNVAEGIATGAKTVAGMRDETTAREAILVKVRDGALAVADMSDALADEAALRPLLALRTIAQGDALARLNVLIDQYRDAMTRARAAEAGVGFEKAMKNSVDHVYELQSVVDDLAHTPLDRALNAANRAANLEAENLGLKNGDTRRTDLVRQREREAEVKYQGDMAKYVSDTLLSQRDGLALSQRELELVGANDNLRQVELDKLKASLEIRRLFPNMAAANVDRIVAGVVAQDEMNAKLKVAAAAMGELRSFGTSLVDTVFDPGNWDSWGSAGKAVLKEIEGEFIKLTLLNPLKNMINGNSDLPTLGSALGKLGSLFGGRGSSTASLTTIGTTGGLSGNAVGTEYWSGGLSWVGENGKELVDLPSGTKVYSASKSRSMAGNDNASGGPIFAFDLRGAVMTEDLMRQMNAIGATAAVRGAAGGAALGQVEAGRSAARTLGRKWGR